MTAPTLLGGETGAQPPPPARREIGSPYARAALMLHDRQPLDVVAQLLAELDEERAGTYSVRYGVPFTIDGVERMAEYPRADRALAASHARRRGVVLQSSIVRRSPWRPAE